MSDHEKPSSYALAKLSEAATVLKGRRGDRRRRVHDASGWVFRVAPFDLTLLQAQMLEAIQNQLTARPEAAGVYAEDPRVMTNLNAMSDEQVQKVESDILGLYEDVKAHFPG